MIPNPVAVAELAVEKGTRLNFSCQSQRDGNFSTYRTKWPPR